MTRIKICGITTLRDALAAVDAGADALGFVFAPSPRRVSPDQAHRIIDRLPPFVRCVGVFRDAPLDDVERFANESGVGVVQLHGGEGADYCRWLDRPILKRFSADDGETAESLRSRVAGYSVSAVLLDPGAGDGRTFPWELARGLEQPVVVAGGLGPDNVARAIRIACPYAVDVSSGVEDEPGHKNPELMTAFVRAVREADAVHAAR